MRDISCWQLLLPGWETVKPGTPEQRGEMKHNLVFNGSTPQVEDYMNEWRAMHRSDTTALLSTMSAQLASIITTTTPMSTSTEASTSETSTTTKETRSRQDNTRYISGKLVTVQKMSSEASTEKTSSTTREARHEGGSRSYYANNQNCCTVLLTDSGKICTKL